MGTDSTLHRVAPLAIVGAFLFDFILGGLWYSPVLFGDAWHTLQGLDATALAEADGRGAAYGLSALGNLIKALFLGVVIAWTKPQSAWDGVKVGLTLWLGFVVTIHFGSTLYRDASMTVLAINMAFHLIVFTISGGMMARFSRVILKETLPAHGSNKRPQIRLDRAYLGF